MRVQQSEECRWEPTLQKTLDQSHLSKTRVKRSSGIHSERHVARKPYGLGARVELKVARLEASAGRVMRIE